MGLPELGRAIRPAFLLDPVTTFLNHGSFGATPRVVLDAQTRWREEMERQPVLFLDRRHDALLAEAGERLAAFLGARPSDLVFVENATSAVNAVARSLRLGPGDAVVTTTHAYPAVRNTLRHVCGTSGARLVEAEIPFPLEGSAPILERLDAVIGHDTRLVVVDHVTSASALTLPVADIVRLCHDRGAPVFVDGAHAPGQVPLDLDALGADWSTGNCHKWLFAPKGCAYLHARPDRQDIHPAVVSLGYGEGFRAEFSWTGTRDPSAWLSVTAALDFVDTLGGAARVRDHDAALCGRASDLLADTWGRPAATPPSLRAAMCTFALPIPCEPTVAACKAVSRRLWEEHRVEVPVFPLDGRCWVRISCQVYNELADYARLAAILG